MTVRTAPASVALSRVGLLCNYVLRFADAADNTVSEELLPVFVSLDGDVDAEVAKTIIATRSGPALEALPERTASELVAKAETLEMATRGAAVARAQEVFANLTRERQRHAAASLDSLERFHRARSEKLRQSILDYKQRVLAGEEMDIAIRRAEAALERLDEECERRGKGIEARRHIRADEPRLLNIAVVVPAK